jgi:ABC-type lipoprotein export system ATPase subunit
LDDAALTSLRRNRIGFIFQSFQLLPTLTVVENVELPLLLAGKSDVRSAALSRLHTVEMETYAGRMPYQLSGGQMQRVAIARALVHKPALLLADEPTGNLDNTTGDHVLSLLRRIATEQGATILMATHSAEAASLADVVVKLRDGRVDIVQVNTIALSDNLP